MNLPLILLLFQRDQVDKKPSSPSSSIARVIAATTPTPTAVPVFDQVLSDPSIDFGSINDFGDGWGSGGGDGGGNGSGDGDGGKGVGRGGGDTALFFGKETSKKLGVVLDISGSTRKSLPEVLEVLSKDFKDAQLVSTISGGLHRIEAEYTVYNIAFKRRNMFSAQEEAFYNIMPKELLKVSHKLENNIIVGHGENKFGCLATGVDYLARSGLCQEIYIFSDFADGIGPGVIEGLKEVLKSKRIKLNCLWVGNSKSSHSLISKLCSKTKGSFESFESRRGDTVAFDIR